ncbi:MAG: CAP domain-containing protein [Bacillota bacterium]|nr:MAG: hypothetical protein DIU55_06690 [Bacillota bacterium]
MRLNQIKAFAVALAVAASALAFAAPASAATTYVTTCKTPVRYSTLNRYVGWGVIRWPQFTVKQTVPARQTPKPTQQPTQQQPAAPKAPAQPQTPTASAGLTAAEQQMLNLINQERAKAGLQPLKADAQLTQLARMKSQDMINKGYFSHNSPTYGSPFDMMKAYGVTYRTAGENIAGNQSVQAAHTALMNSSGHRANILNPNYTHVGIGIVEGGPYGMMFTQMFVGR